VSIPIAIGEQEGSRNIFSESCWRGHKFFIFQRLIDEFMCLCYECLSAACARMCSCWAFQSRKKPEHSAVNRRVVGGVCDLYEIYTIFLCTGDYGSCASFPRWRLGIWLILCPVNQ
jgi:hypothetical protein